MAIRNVIVVEDEPDILEVLEYNLRREGFEVSGCRDGEEGLREIRRRRPDLVVLDLLLPKLDGLEVCRRLRTDPATAELPIIMLTAKGEESDVVLGLGLGADDYVTKPFSPRELVARIRALSRRLERAGSEPVEGELSGPHWKIDGVRHRVEVEGERIPLTATEFRILQCLAGQPGRVFTRDQLIDRAIGEGVAVTDRNIDVHVRGIRKKLGSHKTMIETVRGVGYRFAEDEA